MSQPPHDGSIPLPRMGDAAIGVRSPKSRSTALSLVAYYFLIGAGLGTVFLVFVLSAFLFGKTDLQGGPLLFAAVFGGAVAYASFYAGIKIRARDVRGRTPGLLVAGFGAFFHLIDLATSGSGVALAFLAIEVFALWVLWTTDELVSR